MRRPALLRSGPFALHLTWVEGSDASAPASWRGGVDAVDAPTLWCWRLGLVIPKRHEVSAVARNTIKRRWRDAFRRGRRAWAGEFGSADVVVRLQAPLVPKAAKGVQRSKGRSSGATARGSRKPDDSVRPAPAQVRARDRFDPDALLAGLIDRIRSRGGRPAASRLSVPLHDPVNGTSAASASNAANVFRAGGDGEGA